MLGASAVQLGSAVMLQGYGVIGQMAEALERWMQAHSLSGYEEIRGSALSSLATFEELEPCPMTAYRVPVSQELEAPMESLAACRAACLRGAISADYSVDAAFCDGCGLCASLLPEQYRMKQL